MGEIIRILEGPIMPVDCLSEKEEAELYPCGKSERCLASNLWEKLRNQITQLLDNISLQDMVESKQ